MNDASKVTQARSDLREVYLLAFDNNSTDPSEVADQFDGINIRYARELLSVLTQAKLLNTSEIEGVDVWQTEFSVDEAKRGDVIKRIDTWLDEHVATEPIVNVTGKAKRASEPKGEPKPCLCGCGDLVPSKSFYRPGHDARHAGVVGRALGAMDEPSQADYDAMLTDLPSDRLRQKAVAIGDKARAKATAKAQAKAERDSRKATEVEDLQKNLSDSLAEPADRLDPNAQTEEGTVKVGKNEFVATRHLETGEVVYFDKDVTKQASKTAAKTFQVG